MEDFVPFELTKKLNEKGFNTEFKYSLGYYDTLGNFMSAADHWFLDSWIIAPTISQVLKWLREENNVFILIEPDLMSPSYELVFSVRVKFYIKGEEDEGFREKYLTYRRKSHEQAAIAGIVYCLDNLI